MADANLAVVEIRSDRLVRVEWASRSGNSSKGMLSTAYGILGEVRQNWIEAELGAGNRSRYRK